MSKWEIHKLSQLPSDIKFNINNSQLNTNNSLDLIANAQSLDEYKVQFKKIQHQIKRGNAYLINLTKQTKIKTSYCLKDLYNKSHAKYKLYFKDQFICFSPEQFIKCENNKIFTYPMKGTIDASIYDAKNIILNDKKELAEHTMIVDLLRNDLSIISNNVKVNKFRYCEIIKAGHKKLIQVSSKISGDLDDDWRDQIGNIITSILPAGSITGTPKKQTIKIINKIEDYDRNFFTGIFGIFDGQNLNSAVMIRFIEKNKNNELIYKSGGGITCDSLAEKEYQELLNKIYIP